MKRINEFKGYRSQTEYDEIAGTFVPRRAEDAMSAQEPAGSSEKIEIRQPERSKAVERKLEIPVKSPSGISPALDRAAGARCEARIMFDMVAVIGSRNLSRASCSLAK